MTKVKGMTACRVPDAPTDTISRQALINALLAEDYKEHQYCYPCKEVLLTIKALPSAQPDLCDGCDRYGTSCVGEGCGKLEMPEVAKDTNVPINDCISRQAAIDALDVLCQEHRYRIPGKRETYSEYNEAWQDALDRAEGAIGNLPSAQQEIIRCRDCISYQEGIDINGKPFSRCNGSVRTYGHTLPDWFCADAERRTDGTEQP